MARIQAVALDLFEAHGFAEVSIEAIAAAAGAGPATIYRNFGTKERLVLWDEYDPRLLAALTTALAETDVLTAVQQALTRSLADVYRDERQRILRRARLVRATPALVAASAADQQALRAALASVLRATGHARDELAAQVFAGAIVAAIVAGLDRWLDGDGSEPLTRCFRMALARLRALAGA
jgi:AcrR family transcriptional regulator